MVKAEGARRTSAQGPCDRQPWDTVALITWESGKWVFLGAWSMRWGGREIEGVGVFSDLLFV